MLCCLQFDATKVQSFKFDGNFCRCLSTLYQDPEWSCRDLREPISNAKDKISSSKVGAFSSERLKYYFQELNAMENEGRKASFTDLWGLIIEYFLLQKVRSSKWENKCCCSAGSVSYTAAAFLLATCIFSVYAQKEGMCWNNCGSSFLKKKSFSEENN